MHWINFIKETVRGKDSYRIFSNDALRGTTLSGKVLDVGAGNVRGSHYRYLTLAPGVQITTIDIDPNEKPDIVADVAQGIPQETGVYDGALALNLLEHVRDPGAVLSEIARVLKKGGTLHIIVPFFVRVHPTPHDYQRFTDEGLRQVLTTHGFVVDTLRPFGTGPFLAAHYQLELILPWFVRLCTTPFSCLVDAVLARIRPAHFGARTYPLGYYVAATKI